MMRSKLLVVATLVLSALLAAAAIAGRHRMALLYATPGGCSDTPGRLLQMQTPQGWRTVLDLEPGDCVRSVGEVLERMRLCCASDPDECAAPVVSQEPVQCVATYGL
jgi:hypothetical protein